MPTSSIDATVEQADLQLARGGAKVFRTVRFRLADGSEQTIQKAVTTDAVGDELTPGKKGRFYLYKTFDYKGVHGVRTADGTEVYGYPGNNQRIFMVSGVVSVLWLIYGITVRGGIPILGLGLLILSAVGWYLMSKGRNETRAHFEADAGKA